MSFNCIESITPNIPYPPIANENKSKFSSLEHFSLSPLGVTMLKATTSSMIGFLFKTLPFFARQFWLIPLYKHIGGLFTAYLLGTRIFPGARPKGLRALVSAVKTHLSYLLDEQKKKHRRNIGLDIIQKNVKDYASS